MSHRRKLLIVGTFIGLIAITLGVWLTRPAYERWATRRAATSALQLLETTNYPERRSRNHRTRDWDDHETDETHEKLGGVTTEMH